MYVRFGRLPLIAAAVIAVLCAASPLQAKTAGKARAKTKTSTAKTSAARTPAAKSSTAKATATAAESVPTTAAPAAAAVPVTGSLTVFAASSLSAPFTDVAGAFENANPGANVTLNLAGSSTLVAQIQNGAPADVFASADAANMDKLVKARLIHGPPAIFTRNRLMIVVPKGNPLRVKTLADLAKPEVFVALGANGVPVGDYARQILARAGIEVRPKTLESNVSAIVTKAALREIDAGIVYVTDVAIDDYRVDGVAIPDDQNVVAAYPIGVVTTGSNETAAQAFVAFTQSPAAQAIMARHKFLPLK